MSKSKNGDMNKIIKHTHTHTHTHKHTHTHTSTRTHAHARIRMQQSEILKIGNRASQSPFRSSNLLKQYSITSDFHNSPDKTN